MTRDREIRLGLSPDYEGLGLDATFGGDARFDGSRHLCLYVHGYNVTPAEAAKSFDRFLGLAKRLAGTPTGRAAHLLDDTAAWRVYWPAFGRMGRDRFWLSMLTYSLHAGATPDWAEALCRFITSNVPGTAADPVEVSFVGHSLGCRLILETIRARSLRGDQCWKPRHILLMAAAVPVPMLHFSGRLCAAALEANSSIAFSGWDLVLRLGFPLGQVPEGLPFPEAVGSRGEPFGLWDSQLETTNGHSSYFEDPRTAELLLTVLGHWRRQPIVGRTLPSVHLVPAEVPARALADRTVAEGRLIGF